MGSQSFFWLRCGQILRIFSAFLLSPRHTKSIQRGEKLLCPKALQAKSGGQKREKLAQNEHFEPSGTPPDAHCEPLGPPLAGPKPRGRKKHHLTHPMGTPKKARFCLTSGVCFRLFFGMVLGASLGRLRADWGPNFDPLGFNFGTFLGVPSKSGN